MKIKKSQLKEAIKAALKESGDPMLYKLATTWEDGWQAAKDGMSLDDNPWNEMMQEGKKDE